MNRRIARLWLLVATGLLLAGCGGTVSAPGPGDSPTASEPPAQPTVVSPISPLSPLATPSTAPPEVARPMALVVLHTNDNWGETEPCG